MGSPKWFSVATLNPRPCLVGEVLHARPGFSYGNSGSPCQRHSIRRVRCQAATGVGVVELWQELRKNI